MALLNQPQQGYWQGNQFVLPQFDAPVVPQYDRPTPAPLPSVPSASGPQGSGPVGRDRGGRDMYGRAGRGGEYDSGAYADNSQGPSPWSGFLNAITPSSPSGPLGWADMAARIASPMYGLARGAYSIGSGLLGQDFNVSDTMAAGLPGTPTGPAHLANAPGSRARRAKAERDRGDRTPGGAAGREAARAGGLRERAR